MRILSSRDVRLALPMTAAIAAMRTAFASLSAGRAQVPPRVPLRVDDRDGDTLVMPAFLPAAGGDSGSLGVKVVSVFPHNAEFGLPRINAAVLVLDPRSGVPVALLEGAALTGIRTAAASALATDLLARPDSRTLAIFGAGVQARTHLEAVCTVRPIETVWIYSPTRTKVELLIADMAGNGPIPADLRIAATPAEAIERAEIVCTTTTSPTPVFSDADLRPGTHINAVGSYKPSVAEIPPETVARSLLVVDEREAAWTEAGDLIQPRDAGLIGDAHIHAELGELVCGTKSGRTSADAITLFKSVGNAAQDAAAAHVALRTAEERNLGRVVEW